MYIYIYEKREGGQEREGKKMYTLRTIIKVTLLKAINIFNHEEDIVMFK